MDSPSQNVSVERLSVMHGLLIGVVSVVLNIVFRLIDPMLQFTNWWLGFLILAIVLTLLVVLGIDVRKKIGGYWSFGDAFKSLLIMSVLLVVCSTAYNFVIFKYVDPEMPAKVNAVMLETTTSMMEKFGASQPKIDESTKKYNNGEFEASQKPTLVNELRAVGIGVLMYGIISLIIAACIKKKPALFAPVDENASTIS
jgi:hypothetical protein